MKQITQDKFLMCITMSIYVNRNKMNNTFCLWKYFNISLNRNKTIFARRTKCLLIINFNLIIKWYDIVACTHICLSNTKDRETLPFQRLKDKQCSRFTLQDYTLEGRRTPEIEQHRRSQ